jgi:hypothetical protein
VVPSDISQLTTQGTVVDIEGTGSAALTFGSLSGSFTSHTAGFTLTTNANNIQVTKQ